MFLFCRLTNLDFFKVVVKGERWIQSHFHSRLQFLAIPALGNVNKATRAKVALFLGLRCGCGKGGGMVRARVMVVRVW